MISTFSTEVASTYSTTPSEPVYPRTKKAEIVQNDSNRFKTPYKFAFPIQKVMQIEHL